MNLTSTLRGLRRRPPNFGPAIDLVEADVRHHADAYSPTERIPVVPPETLLIEDPAPEPVPEPEPLPDMGFAIGPQILTENPQWRWVFPFPPAPPDASRYEWVDVADDPAGILIVEDFLGGDISEWCGEGVRVHTSDGVVTAHTGDRIMRDEDGLHVQCTRVFKGWDTGSFEAVDAAIAAGQGDCM